MAQQEFTDAIALLKADHREVEELFAKFEGASGDGKKQQIAEQICTELKIHSMIEEEIFYPALQPVDPEIVAKSLPEHAEVKRLVLALRGMSPGEAGFDMTVMELMRKVIHHVAGQILGGVWAAIDR